MYIHISMYFQGLKYEELCIYFNGDNKQRLWGEMFQDSFSYLLNFQTHILLISIEDIPIGKQRWRSLNYLLVRTLFLIFRKRRVQYQIFIFIYIHAFYKQLSKQYNNMENITHTKNYNTHTEPDTLFE